MFKLKSLMMASITLCGVLLSVHAQSDTNTTQTTTANAQNNAAMTMPKPLENKVYGAMVGTWKGESNMMGMKTHDVLQIRWALNHQFLIMRLVATHVDQPKVKYMGMGVFGVDAQGNAKTWWFDSWGADAMSTGSGVFSDNKLVLTDSNAQYKETRSFEIKGNEMVMNAKGTMTWQGKDTSYDETTVYKRK